MTTRTKQTGVVVKLLKKDRNIFSIMTVVTIAMRKKGFGEHAEELIKEVTSSPSYEVALNTISDYVRIL